jgi:hypothetical protein
MNMKILTILCAAVIVTGCGSIAHKGADPAKASMHEWDRDQFEEFKIYARFAARDVYNGTIIIPLGRHHWSNKKLRRILREEHGVASVNAGNWSAPRYAGYNLVMKAAAEEKNGEGWWFEALKKSGENIPNPD